MSKKTKSSNIIAECVADAKAVASLTKAMRDSSVDNASLFLDTVFKDNAVLKESFTGGMSAALAEKLKQEAADDDQENDVPAVGDTEVSVDVQEPADAAATDGADAEPATGTDIPESEDKIFVQAVDTEGNQVSINNTDPEEVKADAAAAGIELQDPVKTDEPATDAGDADASTDIPTDGEAPADTTEPAADETEPTAEPEEEDEVSLDVNELNEILKELAEDTEEDVTTTDDVNIDNPTGEENIEVSGAEEAPVSSDKEFSDQDEVLKQLQDLLNNKDDAAVAAESAEAPVEEEIDLESILNEIDSDLSEGKKSECKDKDCKKEECKNECSVKEEVSVQDLSEALRVSHEENIQLKKSLQEYKKALDIVKTSLNEASKQLNETTLLNHKLLYTNKLFKDKSLTENQRVSIIEAFDRAHTKREVMITYAIMAENLINSRPNVRKPMNSTISNITEGLASKSVGSTKPSTKILTESINHDDLFTVDRWQEMAGIKSSY